MGWGVFSWWEKTRPHFLKACNLFADPMKACFFGASVTKQRYSYVESLSRLMPGHEFEKFSFGGMHLSDAGICLLDEFLETDAELHFLDWFVTGKVYAPERLGLYLDAICHRLVGRGRNPAFLLLLRRDMNPAMLANYQCIRSYAATYGMLVVDVHAKAESEGIAAEDLLKDVVHTNEKGSDYYAAAIRSVLESVLEGGIPEPSRPPFNKYAALSSTPLNRTVNDSLELDVEDEVVGILQTIGSYSGRVRIHKDGTFLQDRTVWDCWCHYERLAMKIPLQGPGRFTVEVSQETIDRSSCKRQIDDWGQFGPNKLVVHDIFHAG